MSSIEYLFTKTFAFCLPTFSYYYLQLFFPSNSTQAQIEMELTSYNF